MSERPTVGVLNFIKLNRAALSVGRASDMEIKCADVAGGFSVS